MVCLFSYVYTLTCIAYSVDICLFHSSANDKVSLQTNIEITGRTGINSPEVCFMGDRKITQKPLLFFDLGMTYSLA